MTTEHDVRHYIVEECDVFAHGDPLGWLIASHRALIHERKVPLDDAPDGETGYRYCLDALIATVHEWRLSERRAAAKPFALLRAQMRADELAGRMFDKWIGEW